MEHLVYYDIAAAFVLLTALAAYHLRKYSDNFQSRVYRVMLYALLVVSTSDFLLFWEEITFGKTGTTVLLYICILGQVVAAAAYLLYILCLTGRVERFIRKEKGWLFVPAWIVIALLVVQLFIPYLFKVGTYGSYQRQNGIMLFYLCMIYFYLMGEVFLVRFRKRLSFELLFSTTVFAVVSVFTLVLHIAFPGFRFQFFGMAMCVLLYLISSERPQEYTVPELEIMNRRAFLKESEERLLGSERFPMLVIKVHNLKVMRQTLGNDSVNEFLKEMAAFFRKLIDNSRIYQFSQSVYVLALDRKKKDIDSSLLIRQILNRFEQPWHSGSVETKFRIHISSIVCPRDTNNLNGLIDYIQYMRSISSENGNVVLKTAEMDIDRPKRELRIRKLLNDAVDHKGFEVFYQPIYSVTENRIVSAEALVRLKDQSMGYISPEEFIPIAEKSGMIMQIGEFVFETVCRFIREKQLTDYGLQYIEINLSVVQCMQENLAERLTEIMKKYHVAPAQINLEITETAAAHSDMLENNIKILHKQGIEFSLDDYGSGYSNTDYLFRFPFRIVKIDKTILWEAFKNEKAMIALRNTIRMIKELGLEIVVEGVENQEYVDYLTEQHCDYLQGYFYSKPIPDRDFLELLRRENAQYYAERFSKNELSDIITT